MKLDRKEVRDVVFAALKELPVGEFSGRDLVHFIQTSLDVECCPATVLRYMRDWRSRSQKYDIKLVNRAKSRYEKVASQRIQSVD